MQKGRRGSWVEVDLRAIKENYKRTMARLENRGSTGGCGRLPPAGSAEAIAVIKSNAYGHGDVSVARALHSVGVRRFAVASLDEAARLRSAGLSQDKCDVLILGYTPPKLIGEVAELGAIQTVISAEYAREIAALGISVRTHLAVDTGMRRIGIDAANGVSDELSAVLHLLRPSGMFSHLATADSEDDDGRRFTALQLGRFSALLPTALEHGVSDFHILNSAGILYHADNVEIDLGRLVRPGIMLYGLSARSGADLPPGFSPALAWRTYVAMVKTVKRGDYIGYGRSFRAERDMTVATLPVGYGDGYPRMLSGVGSVLIGGVRAPIIGRICMNQMTVDVSGCGPVQAGDEVTLIGKSCSKRITSDELGALRGSIGYEIVTGICESVPRLYIDD